MSNKNIEAVQQIYAAFGRGDIPAVLEFVADDIDWGIAAESAPEVPFYGLGKGKAFAVKFFQNLGANVEFRTFVPTELLASENGVAALITSDVTLKKNGKQASYENIHHFTFKNGKVVRWRGWEDTARTKALWNS